MIAKTQYLAQLFPGKIKLAGGKKIVLCCSWMYCAPGPDMSKLLFWPCHFPASHLMTAYSLTYIEHHHAGRNCHHPWSAARNAHHGAAWICSHSSYAEGRAPRAHWDPCHSNSYHSCKREVLTLNAFVFCNLSKQTADTYSFLGFIFVFCFSFLKSDVYI